MSSLSLSDILSCLQLFLTCAFTLSLVNIPLHFCSLYVLSYGMATLFLFTD